MAIVPTLPEDNSLLSCPPARHVAIVLVDGVEVVAEQAMDLGRLASRNHARFVHFDIDGEETSKLTQTWEEHEPGVELKIEEAPFRELATP